MDRAQQDALQDWINEARRTRLITPLCRDIAEAMIWKCRKREDGRFMAGYKALAGMARGCCRDTAIAAVTVLQRIGFLAKEHTRAWCGRFKVQGKNIYRLVLPPRPESENPTPDSSQNLDSFLLEKEVAHEQESEEVAPYAQHDPAVEPEMGALSPDGAGTRGLADGGEPQRPAESRSGRVGGTGVWPGPAGPARLFAEGMMTLGAVLAERQRKIAQEWRDRGAGSFPDDLIAERPRNWHKGGPGGAVTPVTGPDRPREGPLAMAAQHIIQPAWFVTR
jgi:hypothetical protein